MHWLKETLIGLVFLVPAILSIGFFKRTFNISADVFIIWYYLGIVITLLLATKLTGGSLSKFISSPVWVLLGIVAIGLTVGAGANIFTFRAYANSPNPGIVQAIQEAAVPLIFILTIFLAWLAPKHFSTGGQIDTFWSVSGIATTLVGVFILIFKAIK